MDQLANTVSIPRSLGGAGRHKLLQLAAHLALSERQKARALTIFERLSGSFATWEVGGSRAGHSDITDDGTPFEFSVAFEDGPELRLLVEAQAHPFSIRSGWEAALALTHRLKDLGAHLAGFDRISDLFVPSSEAAAGFSLWHGAAVGPAKDLFKVYLNPRVHGSEAAPELLRNALGRLGRLDAWDFLEKRLSESEAGDDLRYFSLDLKEASTARLKVYMARESASETEWLARGAANLATGEASSWIQTFTGSHGPFRARPILTCFAFKDFGKAPDATIHVPIRCYSPSDRESLNRIARVLSDADTSLLEQSVRSIADRDLDLQSGILTYASCRKSAGRTRVTLYLAPECHTETENPGNDSVSIHASSIALRRTG